MKKIKLFCIPFAGGSSNFFHRWKQYADDDLEIIPIELAGRGKRIESSIYNTLEEATRDIYTMIVPQIQSCNYAIFGHSMGALISFELAHLLKDNNIKMPEHIFFSGKNPPHIKSMKKKIAHLPEPEFIEEIIKLGGTSKEVFEFEELRNLVVPILKADYNIVEKYEYHDKQRKVMCNFTVLYGKHDTFTSSKITEWCNFTDGECRVHEFNGGHFFINDNPGSIVKIINETLLIKENVYF